MYYQEIERIFSIDTLFLSYIQTEQMHKSKLFAKKY